MRNGDWMQTFTGIRFYPSDPRPEEMCITDIAHHLALQCRFNGACKQFYSIAQHSVLVSQIVPAEYAQWGLMHDAAEAYMGDLVRPIKRGIPEFRQMEEAIMAVVAKRFGLTSPQPNSVTKADNIVLYTERRDLLADRLEWTEDTSPVLSERIYPILPKDAERAFLRRFAELTTPALTRG